MAKDKAENMEATGAQGADASAFGIEKLYVKDASIEVPNAPQIFTERTMPEINVELGNAAQQVDAGIFDVSIKVTVTAKIGDKTAFLVEVTQAGIFVVRNVPEENMGPILAVACPNILFPYAREAISDMVTRAGFMPVLLNPINFEALYMQQQAQAGAAN
jgi:preprotein translocase subunit SecB